MVRHPFGVTAHCRANHPAVTTLCTPVSVLTQINADSLATTNNTTIMIHRTFVLEDGCNTCSLRVTQAIHSIFNPAMKGVLTRKGKYLARIILKGLQKFAPSTVINRKSFASFSLTYRQVNDDPRLTTLVLKNTRLLSPSMDPKSLKNFHI